ncbi:futalosine hydrolase [Streptomyces sp. NPDC090025]|uniref:futalosine hydrolase n=1 Tax=Streptomyces sp. NPDC090025 TaxID=3365922 RepID=UPI0038366105
MTHRILIVTAVAAEADSVATGLASAAQGTAPGTAPDAAPRTESVPLPGGFALRRLTLPGRTDGLVVDVLVAGVGPAMAAAATATALAVAASAFATGAPAPYDLVVSAGIAGGFLPRAPIGTVVVSDAVVAADLGAETPDGYLPVDRLGFGRSAHPVAAPLTTALAGALGAAGVPYAVGPVLTVSTVTGTARRAAELAERHPGAAAEAMEGFGVAEAAAAHGVPVVEIRAVSNAVGPRDRAAWRIGDALAALAAAFRTLAPHALVSAEPLEPPS